MPSTTAALTRVRREAASCARCPLYRVGTQTVFGEGPEHAPLMLVGEQPGDQEDLQGRPFVGPAGRMLDKALAAAAIDREQVYVTNAVKHFKNVPRGKRRLHQRPNAHEIDRCKWWLDLELDIVQPELVVALGATAARALTGRATPVEVARGRVAVLEGGRRLVITIHPSLLLRLRDSESREKEFGRFVEDLRSAAKAVPTARRRATRRTRVA